MLSFNFRNRRINTYNSLGVRRSNTLNSYACVPKYKNVNNRFDVECEKKGCMIPSTISLRERCCRREQQLNFMNGDSGWGTVGMPVWQAGDATGPTGIIQSISGTPGIDSSWIVRFHCNDPPFFALFPGVGSGTTVVNGDPSVFGSVTEEVTLTSVGLAPPDPRVSAPPDCWACCNTSHYRNPLAGYRKQLVTDCSCSLVDPSCVARQYIYKDNWAVKCATHPEVCYNPVIRTIQNRNGYINEQYNYSAKQYLNRRCRTYEQQTLNYNASLVMDPSCCKTKFATACSRISARHDDWEAGCVIQVATFTGVHPPPSTWAGTAVVGDILIESEPAAAAPSGLTAVVLHNFTGTAYPQKLRLRICTAGGAGMELDTTPNVTYDISGAIPAVTAQLDTSSPPSAPDHGRGTYPPPECIVNCDNCETVACRGYSKCAPKNANCCSIYKRSNAPFSRQGAVSGGSRINRLKYQTVLKSQST